MEDEPAADRLASEEEHRARWDRVDIRRMRASLDALDHQSGGRTLEGDWARAAFRIADALIIAMRGWQNLTWADFKQALNTIPNGSFRDLPPSGDRHAVSIADSMVRGFAAEVVSREREPYGVLVRIPDLAALDAWAAAVIMRNERD